MAEFSQSAEHEKCTQTPPCTDLIADPEGVLRDKDRWPKHLCYEAMMRRSTEIWAGRSSPSITQAATRRWLGEFPLPIGRRAVMLASSSLREPEKDNPGQKGAEELLSVVPFEKSEEAIWALRIEHRQLEAVRTLDLFGLAEYPTQKHRARGTPIAGPLAFSIRGYGRFWATDLLDAAERWWAQFSGLSLKGRPRGTGTWPTREAFLSALEKAAAETRFDGQKVTQETVAKRFFKPVGTSARQLRTWCREHEVDWRQTTGN